MLNNIQKNNISINIRWPFIKNLKYHDIHHFRWDKILGNGGGQLGSRELDSRPPKNYGKFYLGRKTYRERENLNYLNRRRGLEIERRRNTHP